MDWLLIVAPLLAEIRNVKKLAGRSPTCVYIPARGREQPLSHTSRYAVVVRDADDECAEDNCIKVPTTGKSAAVEYIVNSANCEYVAIFDSDVYFTPTDAERLAAAASDFGFVMMALYRFVWGGAVAGRKETLARVMRGVSNAVSDDMYATARAKALGVPIRFIYLRLISPPPADSPRTVFKWIQRQYAMAARLGPPAVKVGLAALAIWLATWVLYPHALLIYAVAGYIRRKALGVPATPLYIPAAAVAYAYTLAAVVLGFLTREVEWRGRVVKLNTKLPGKAPARHEAIP
jgi:hypothetical protein